MSSLKSAGKFYYVFTSIYYTIGICPPTPVVDGKMGSLRADTIFFSPLLWEGRHSLVL